MYLNEITEDIYKELNDTSITNEHKRNLIKLLLKDHDEENPFIITKEICLDFLFFSCLKAIESNCSLNFLNTLLNFIIEQCLNPSDNFVQNLKELVSSKLLFDIIDKRNYYYYFIFFLSHLINYIHSLIS